MSFWTFDINGDTINFDHDTGQLYDSSHNQIGHFDHSSHSLMDAHGNVLAHYDPSNHHWHDANHNFLGSFGSFTGIESPLTTFSGVDGQAQMHLDANSNQILDSSFNSIGAYKKLW